MSSVLGYVVHLSCFKLLMEKNPHLSGPTQLKLMLLKGQLYYTYKYIICIVLHVYKLHKNSVIRTLSFSIYCDTYSSSSLILRAMSYPTARIYQIFLSILPLMDMKFFPVFLLLQVITEVKILIHVFFT